MVHPSQYVLQLPVWPALIPDFPLTTSWLTEEEKRLATVRLAIREDLEDEATHKEAFIAAVKDPKTWVSWTGTQTRVRSLNDSCSCWPTTS